MAGSAALAQRPHFSAGGGLSLPTDNSADNGFQVQGSLDVTLPVPALAVRVDAQYDRFPFTFTPTPPCPTGGCVPQDGHESMVAGTLNGVLQVPRSVSPVSPYLVGGIGLYHHSTDDSARPSGTDFGVNAGGGLRLRLEAVQLFAEARFHVVKNTTNFVPLVVGLRF